MDHQEIQTRAEELAASMSLTEKIGQLVNAARPLERLGIPAYNWWNEGLHGVARAGKATMFPQAIAMAAMFHPALMRRIGEAVGLEARAKYNEYCRRGEHGAYTGLTLWTPNINLFRDPRFPRGQETYGEDPYLAGRTAAAFIRGVQREREGYMTAAACAKHFACYSGPEQQRHGFNAAVSFRDLYESYTPAFRRCVKEGRVEAVMSAYNAVNGVPCSCNRFLLTDLLRETFGFTGHVVSDCGAIKDIYESHRYLDTPEEAAAAAVRAGCDLECGGIYFFLERAVEDGLISEAEIDAALIRVMSARLRLGILGRTPLDDVPYETVACPAHLRLAARASRECLVLLKNEGGRLPLAAGRIRVGLAGPNADNRCALTGNYFGTPPRYVTVLDALRAERGIELEYAEGCGLTENPNEYDRGGMAAEADAVFSRSDVVVLCLGVDCTVESEEGDGLGTRSRGYDGKLPAVQRELFFRACASGKPIVAVLFSGGGMTGLEEVVGGSAAVIQAFYPGAEGGKAVADLLRGRYSPSGRLPVTMYRDTSCLPPQEDYSMAGRTYRYTRQNVLFRFGFGLSYARFCLTAESALYRNGCLKVRFLAENLSGTASALPVQLYVQRLDADGAPLEELKGLSRLTLRGGQKKRGEILLPVEELRYYEGGEYLPRPGRYRVWLFDGQSCSNALQVAIEAKHFQKEKH